jgi:hypothetical protein
LPTFRVFSCQTAQTKFLFENVKSTIQAKQQEIESFKQQLGKCREEFKQMENEISQHKSLKVQNDKVIENLRREQFTLSNVF